MPNSNQLAWPDPMPHEAQDDDGAGGYQQLLGHLCSKIEPVGDAEEDNGGDCGQADYAKYRFP